MKNIWKIFLIIIAAVLAVCLIGVIFLGLRWLPSVISGFAVRGAPRSFIPNNPLFGPGISRRYLIPGVPNMPFLGRFTVLGLILRAGMLLTPLLVVGLMIAAIVLLLRSSGRTITPVSTVSATPNAAPVPASSGNPCPNCGRQVQEGWVACPYCGHNLQGTNA